MAAPQASSAQNSITRTIEICAPLSRVWRALTDYRQFGEWFRVKLGSPFVAGQPASGNVTYPGYEHLQMDVVVKAIEPESYFAYTWHPFAIDPAVDYSQETPTLVEFRLAESAAGTTLTVTESGFDDIPAARRDEAYRMNTGGWAQQMQNIEEYVTRPS